MKLMMDTHAAFVRALAYGIGAAVVGLVGYALIAIMLTGMGDQLYVDWRGMARRHGHDEGIKRSGRQTLPDRRRFADLCRGVDGGDSDWNTLCERTKPAEAGSAAKA